MISIALTGGVATGKSSVAKLLKKYWADEGAFFSADAAVHVLLTTEAIKTKVSQVFGDGVVSADGEIDRGALRKVVFRDESLRRKLERMIHPEVQTMAIKAESGALEDRKRYLVYEIPLLYEVESPVRRQADLVVAASRQVQENRLIELRGLPKEIIEQIFKAQMPIEQKMARADYVIWNDGSEAELEEQVMKFAALIEGEETDS